jgi:perosamine synthetase
MKINIPVARPDLSGNEEKYVVDALRTSWISSTGEYINRFELEFADVCRTQACISVCNGTVALHLALLTLDIATANAVRYVGAEPVFVDVDPNTWCIDPQKIEDAITPRTKGIIAVHLYGHPADMDEINHIAGVNGLWVVEDAAEAPLTSYKGRPTGGLASIASFSFYGNKVITSGEGGALTMSDSNLALRARTLRGQGMDPKRRYYFPVTGYNFRLTNLACAILCAQLERREQILQRRTALYRLYKERLSQVRGVRLQPCASWAVLSPWLFSITIERDEFGATRDQLMHRLAEAGIETRPFFIPLHTLPPFREASRRRSDDLPVTNLLSSSGVNLPTFSSMTDSSVHQICDAIEKTAR